MELLKRSHLLALVLLVGSCTRIETKPPASFEDSLTVEAPVAVFFRPDSMQLEKIKAVYSKTVFQNLTHDGYFLMRNATEVIRRYWPRIKIVETSTHRWLLFKKATGMARSIDLNKINDICGIFLFDGTKDPIHADMPNIDSQLWFYFGRALK